MFYRTRFFSAWRPSLWLAAQVSLGLMIVSCGDDAATDASDAAMEPDADEAGPACVSDDGCDDGLFCNGLERCSEGMCRRGQTVVCDDGIACTVDRCSEETRGCESAAPDEDGDGRGDSQCTDGTGMPLGDDCDDTDANRFVGNVEVCDEEGHDEDCDPTTFGVVDLDNDGFLDARCCNGETCGNDCDDVRISVNPAGTEACDGVDNNCDGVVDEGVAIDGFADVDRDGRGDPDAPMRACASTVGFSEFDDDCDDSDPTVHGAQVEICDMKDNDCDDDVDEEAQSVDWFRDIDGDGFGSSASGVVVSCEPVADHVLLGTDCNDEEAGINPAAAELCDGVDNDCNGSPDFEIGTNNFEDDDADGIVDIACGAPLGVDCDDNNPLTGPGTVERCDGRDNDCDERIDEGAMDRQWLLDLDGDTYGSLASGSIISCEPVPGYAALGGDCDDNNALRLPGGSETCNAQDEDCDGTVDEGEASSECALTNAQSVCLFGACEVRECTPGFGNCDDRSSNGCEQPLNTVEACGECGRSCLQPNTSSACVGGDCQITACDPSWADCDGSAESGCETNIDTPENCGGCGNRCDLQNANASCGGGECRVEGCFMGFANCDGDDEDGCETPIDTDVNNCGGCGRTCVFANGTGQCVAGECVLTSCATDFADCDGRGDNGCEADLNNDPQTCGGCFAGCFFANADAQCVGGACQRGVCNAGWEDCDGSSGNGCEAFLADDVENCGACFNRCFDAFPGSVPQCTGSTCVFSGTCDPDFADCDGMSGTGCEQDIRNDANHCGGCDMVCNIDKAMPMCVDQACQIAGCDPGFADCNGMTSDGCERDVTSDTDNCGSCGRACGAGGMCGFGQCDEIRTLSAGAKHTCAVREAGAVVCWGDNDDGQLGNGGGADSSTPVETGIFDGVIVAAGVSHSCAVLSNGELACWGLNTNGQLGDGGTGPHASPNIVTRPIGMASVIDVAVGEKHTCALTTDATVWCWGSNEFGQLGDGTTSLPGTTVNSTPLMTTGFSGTPIKVAAGLDHTCVQMDFGEIQCFGRNNFGQLGVLGTMDTATPSTVVGSPTWGDTRNLVLGARHTCVVRSGGGGTLWCWGDNGTSQLARMMPPFLDAPDQISGVTFVIDAYAGDGHTCALTSLNELRCWGANTGDMLGVGSAPDPLSGPQPVGGLPGVQRVPQSGFAARHTCAVDSPNNLQCWGENDQGQLGVAVVSPVEPTPSVVQNLGFLIP